MTLQGKVALITGGGRGIGATTARLLAARGTHVIVNYLQNRDAAEQVVREIQADSGQAIAVQANIRNPEQAGSLVEVALQTYNRIDILVNSTSPSGVMKPFAAINWDEFVLAVNNELKAAFEITKAVVPVMQEQQYGRLIYIASGLAKAPTLPDAISIGTAKGGLVTFVKYIAKEFGRDGITANIVSPGLVETELSAKLPVEQKQRIVAMTPLGRVAQPEDIARAITFFADDDSGFMTGTYAPVNGGIAME